MHSGNSDVKMPTTLNNMYLFKSINKILLIMRNFIDYALVGREVRGVFGNKAGLERRRSQVQYPQEP